jgi:hypothetical protein
MADILVLYGARPYFLEVKRPGSYQTPEQREFQKRAEFAGALYAQAAHALRGGDRRSWRSAPFNLWRPRCRRRPCALTCH